jgi:ribose 1,5-bisphosphokinase PhnN
LYKSIKNYSKKLKSIQITNPNKWSELHSKIKGIMIVGSTCSGKSTIVNQIRNSLKKVKVPKRIITRPQRLNDNLIENTFRTKDEFQKMITNHEIGLNWTRKMEGKREEQYGFEIVAKEKFAVYSGNNALYNNKESVRPKELLENHLYVGIYAPDKIRKERLLERSPDMKTEEVSYRLNDKSENILEHCHIIVNNFDSYQKNSGKELMDLINFLQNNFE